MTQRAYHLGPFTLVPNRELLRSGEPVRIGRKPLALLSCLASADGALVTKDELMETVWPNMIIEENAIQAQIAALRRLLGPEASRLATVHGFGYRLATDAGPTSAPSHGTGDANRARGFRILASLMLLAALLAGAVWLLRGHPERRSSSDRTVAVLPFEAASENSDDRKLARDVTSAVAVALGNAGMVVLPPAEAGAFRGSSPAAAARKLGAAYVLYGSLHTGGGFTRATIRADEARSGTTILTDEAQAASAERVSLPDWTAATAAEAIAGPDSAMIRLTAQSDSARAAGDLRILSAIRQHRPIDGWTAARQSASMNPGSGTAQYLLAYASVYALDALEPSARPGALAGGRAAAVRAAQLIPKMGDARIPLCRLWRTDLARCERIYRQALAVDPDASRVPTFLVFALMQAGRFAEADAMSDIAFANAPYRATNVIQALYIAAIRGKRADEAELLQRARRYWPWNRYAQQWLIALVSAGRTTEAVAYLDDPTLAEIEPDVGIQPIHAVLRALKSRTAADRGVARATCISSWQDGIAMPICIDGLALLGDRDAAFEIAGQALADKGAAREQVDRTLLDRGTEEPVKFFLFGAAARSLRDDPRFVTIAGKAGLLDYWRQVRPPDFCRIEPASVCKSLAIAPRN